LRIEHAFTFLVVLAVCAGVSARARAAGGLSLGPAEITVENLPPGGVYNLDELGGIRFTAQNRGDAEASISVKSVVPGPDVMKEGYEPVPDTEWIEPSAGMFENVGSMETRTLSVTIKIPDGDEYLGKKYQGAIEAVALPPGSAFGVGVAVGARILFSISPERPAAEEEATDAAKPEKAVSISTNPFIIDAGTVRAGSVTAVSQPVEVTNPNERDVQVRMSQLTLEQSRLKNAPDCESLPDGFFLVMERRLVDVPAGATVKVPFYVAMPDKPEYKGKTFAVVVNASVENRGGPSVGTYTIVKFKVE